MSKKKKHSAVYTGFLLWQAANAWQRQIKLALDPVGLTHVQYLLLDSLDLLGGKRHAVTQVKLARKAGTDVMMTSKVVRLLERKKFISRKTDHSDGRAMLIELTDSGSKALNRAKNLVAKNEQQFFLKMGKPVKFAQSLQALIPVV